MRANSRRLGDFGDLASAAAPLRATVSTERFTEGNGLSVSRRQLIAGALSLSSIPISCLPTAAAATADLATGAYLAPTEVRTLSLFCDVILPETDTGGALVAGTVEYIEALFFKAPQSEQAAFRRGLTSLGNVFFQLSGDTSERLISVLRNESENYPPEAVEFLRNLKKAVVISYYTSEIGASQELVYAPVPGPYIPEVQVTEETRAFSNDTGALL